MNRVSEPTEDQLRLGRILSSIVLVSSSPNRRKLLLDAGIAVTVFVPDADESTAGLETEEAMKKNAITKMQKYLSSSAFDEKTAAVSADTLVEIDGTLLGKPQTREDAFRMLSTLSGRRQRVYTGCSLYIPQEKETITFCDRSDVVFRPLTPEDISSYLDKDEWKGAAGAYRLQKTGYTLVEKIDGDFSTVVGLPIRKMISLLQPRSSS